jgi:hypothetical protein
MDLPYYVVMSLFSPYRRHKGVVLALAALFFVFNVGLPVVTASCPMKKAPGKSTCTMCIPPSTGHGPSIVHQANGACCKTVIASGRNLTEFLTVESFPHAAGVPTAQTICRMIPSALSMEAVLLPHNYTPLPAPGDIPIMVSSLLI